MEYSAEENRVYRILLERARRISVPLTEAIRNVGPVSSRRVNHPSLGHFLARAIIGQQLSARAARSIWNRVTTAARNAQLEVPAFAESDVDAIRLCGVSMNKIRALQSVRVAQRTGTLRETQREGLNPQDRVATLLRIHGIGPWTCDMALIFYFKLPNIWPEGDAAVQRTFSGLIGRRNPKLTASKFSPYRSSLALVMWHVADKPL